MARYDGLIIPRSYNEYINKTDPIAMSQALQLNGVMDDVPTAGSVKPVKSGGVAAAFSGLKTYEVTQPDFKNTLLIADITDWYNSTSSATTQLVYFGGFMTAYRGGSPVCYSGTIQLYVSNYRSGQRINDVRSSVRMNGVSNRDVTFEAEVVEYNNRQYLAIKRNSDQSTTLRFLVSTNGGFEPLFTGLDRRTETITEIYKDTSYPIAPRESGTYNLQCIVSAAGVPTYQWGTA